MDFEGKKCLADEFCETQPDLFSEILALKQMEISRERVEFVLNIVLICFLAVRKSGKFLPQIRQDEINRETARFLEIVGIENWFNQLSIDKALNQTLRSSPEKVLSGFTYTELILFYYNVLREKNDKYLIMVTTALVNCIECALSEHNNQFHPTQKTHG